MVPRDSNSDIGHQVLCHLISEVKEENMALAVGTTVTIYTIYYQVYNRYFIIISSISPSGVPRGDLYYFYGGL